MNFSAVYHRTSDNYCYAFNENELIINLSTGYEVKRIFLHHGDPFLAGILGGKEVWNGQKEELYYKKRLKHHMWWTATIRPPFKRLKYYFELHTDTEVWFYFEDGFFSKEQLNIEGKSMQCFTFPWMNVSDINKTPSWVNQTVWYQIFPDRFYNGDVTNDPRIVSKWHNGNVTNKEFYGGDLEGIRKKLEYLSNLGITGIYLTPINEADTSHKYDTINYEKIDPHFGDQNTVRQLVSDAHKLGIRVMLDGVFNHCGPKFKPWLDVLSNGKNSKYFDWFIINEWPIKQCREDVSTGKYYTFAFADYMPKLNTNNDDVIEYFIEICEHWVKHYDIDGIRFDVANEISHKFVKRLRNRIKAIKSDVYLLGEIWHDSIGWLHGDEFDAVMNYPLTGSIKDFWVDKDLTKDDFEFMINRCYTMYMQQTNDVLFNLLDSHDTIRLRSSVSNLSEFYQQLCVLFTMPGSPCIFYGTEIAMEGGHDPDCRRCMPWEDIESGAFNDRIDFLRELIHYRKQEEVFRCRNFHFPNTIANKRVIEYIKIDYNTQLEVIINCSKDDIFVPEKGEILIAMFYDNQMLKENGILIRKYDTEVRT